MSLRDQVLGAKDFQVRPVDCPEWGCTVHVRTLDGHGRASIVGMMATNTSAADWVRSTPDIVQLVACDQDGNRLFGPQDIEALAGRDFKALDRVALAGLVLNGLSGEAVEQAKND